MTRRALVAFLLAVAVSLLAPAAGMANSYDPSGFHFSSPTYSVDENAGSAVITITRSDTSREAYAYYIAVGMGHQCGSSQCTATSPFDMHGVPSDFGATKGTLDFPAGASSESFTVPIVDHHFTTISKTLSLDIYASYPIGTTHDDHAVLTITGNEPTTPRDPANPLELATTPPAGNPLYGAPFYVWRQSPPAHAAQHLPALRVIAGQPFVERFGYFSGKDVGIAVNRYLVQASAEGPGTIPMLATYRLVDNHCGNWTPPPSDVANYHYFVDRFAQGIGSYRAVLFLEMDSLITVGCLSHEGVNVRMSELRYAIDTLTANCPHLVIYLDAGAADAVPAPRIAQLLRQAGVAQIQGFFLNSTHFDWTSREILFGEQVSRMTGGKHFIVNTGFNGRGPLAPPDPARQGNEELCDPPGRGLGPKPTTATGYLNVDAFEWTTNPGESFGPCGPGAPPLGDYWDAYALSLVRNANFNVDHRYAGAAAYVDGGAARAQSQSQSQSQAQRAAARPHKAKSHAHPARRHKRVKKARHHRRRRRK